MVKLIKWIQKKTGTFKIPNNIEEAPSIIEKEIKKIISIYKNIFNNIELSNLNHHLRNYSSWFCSKVSLILIQSELSKNKNTPNNNCISEYKEIMSKLIQIELYWNKKQLGAILIEKDSISNSSTIFNNI